ncbi:DUF4349 domain-containing protein [Gulosibacter chungangensis]|uniref:DUF4349 domain-containing protein n=1 Tax=Gulosibacter chungangensis TaxID=979746 RepID=A0A7J5BAV0_9MICO|nr:DUF4349 domain-containing protein [Gulosibacter chungangensis]KAB1643165.1 DUF4349 domain-containing protein [Gulosibacter chungangensis]
MSTSTSQRLMGGLVAGLATLALLTGCAGAGGSTESDRGERSEEYSAPSEEFVDEAPMDGAAEDSEQSEAGGAAPSDTNTVADRDIITTTSADVRVEDVPGSVSKLEQLVAKYDGRIEARTERTNDTVPEAYLTIRVPAEHNDAFLTELKELGEVTQIESFAVDVTLDKVDLESRISSLQSSIASLESMLEQATNVEDMLDIEQELSQRQAELQSLEAQLEVLSEDVAMSTVYVNLTTNATPQPIDEPTGFFAGLVKGWNDFVDSLNDFVTDFGYALPGLALLLIILAALWFFVIRPIWKRLRKQALPHEVAPEPYESATNSDASPQPEPAATSLASTQNNPDEPGNSQLPPLPKLD